MWNKVVHRAALFGLVLDTGVITNLKRTFFAGDCINQVHGHENEAQLCIWS